MLAEHYHSTWVYSKTPPPIAHSNTNYFLHENYFNKMPINNKEIFKVGNSENNNFQMLSTFLSSQLDLAKQHINV